MRNWQGFQATPGETRYCAVFQAISVNLAPDLCELLLRIILAPCGLEPVLPIVANSKKILSDSKSGYICCS
jgi:hypothetical protein